MANSIDYDWYSKNMDKWFFNVDKAVINALEFFCANSVTPVDLGKSGRVLGVGSGNAKKTVEILLEDRDAVCATESTYQRELATKRFDSAVLLSASGEKHAPKIAETLKKHGLDVTLLTCNPNAPAKDKLDLTGKDLGGKDRCFVFPKIPEPYTYNTVTYMGMVLGKTREDPGQILRYIKDVVAPQLDAFGDIGRVKGYYFLVPENFDNIRGMTEIKFQELFGRRISKDFFTPEFANKHATDIVTMPDELIVSFGHSGDSVRGERLTIPFPENAGYGTIMAAGYYLVGKIQQENPPWFRDSLVDWCKRRGIEPLVK